MLNTVAVSDADTTSAIQDAGGHALPLNGHLSLVTTIHSLVALESQWQELELSCKNSPSVFLSYAWVSSWVKTYISDNSKAELCIITGFEDSKLVFVLPLMKQRRGPVTVLRWLSEPSCQYGDALVSVGQNSNIWLGNALHFIKRLKGIDIIRLRHVRADANIQGFCLTNMHDARLRERAPFLDLTAYPNDESYDARYTPTQRKRRKKIRKELEQRGPLEFRILPNGTLTDSAMAEATKEKNEWLEERGRHNQILKCGNHLKFLKEMSRSSGSTFEMVTSELRAGDKPVSWEIGFNFCGTHFAYITSHVNALTDLSPGRLHMDLSQRHCIKQGLQKFDLMVPHDAHKESWSSGCVETNDYYVPLTLWGRVFGQVYLRMLRPALRRIYYRTPPWVLKTLKPMLGT
jgi:CelD/BcsL family acetyltransferase involved in cellulose biosynthesis